MTRRLLVLGVVAAAIAAGAVVAQAPSVKLSGTVTTAAREPVTGAVVALLTGSGVVPDTPALRQVQPLSTPDGRFEWPAVPVGAYRVVVASAEALKDWPAPATVQRFSQRAFPISLNSDPAGVQMEMVVEIGPPPGRDINLVNVSVSMTMAIREGGGGPPPGAPPRPPGSAPIGPRPMTGPSSISGVLTDQNGQPLAGIQVQTGRWQSTPATSAILPFGMPVTTDSTGAYRIAGLQPGTYLVGAMPWKFDVQRIRESTIRNVPAETDASGQRIAHYTTYYPGVVSPRGARVITIDAGETRGIDFVVHRGPVSTLTVQLGQPGTRLSGNTIAYLMPVALPDQFGQRAGLRAIPSADGVCTFADLQPGQYALTYFGDAGWVRETINVTPSSVARTSPLKPYVTVSGRVDFRTIRIAPGSAALASLMVGLNPSPATAGSILRSRPVSADGTFSIPKVAGGPYMLTIAPGQASWVPLSGVINGQDSLDRPVEISADVTGATLTVTDVATTVQGRVIGMTSGSVVVFSSDSRFWNPGGVSRRVKVVTIMPAGVFTVSGLPPGTYHAAAFPEGTRIVNSALEEAKERTIPFELAIGEQKEIVVR